MWLITGKRGPFSKPGVRKECDVIAGACLRLWPLGPPSRNDAWYRAPNSPNGDYVEVMEKLSPSTVPMPIISRWYDIELYVGSQEI